MDEPYPVVARIECSPVILDVKFETGGFLEGHLDSVKVVYRHVEGVVSVHPCYRP